MIVLMQSFLSNGQVDTTTFKKAVKKINGNIKKIANACNKQNNYLKRQNNYLKIVAAKEDRILSVLNNKDCKDSLLFEIWSLKDSLKKAKEENLSRKVAKKHRISFHEKGKPHFSVIHLNANEWSEIFTLDEDYDFYYSFLTDDTAFVKMRAYSDGNMISIGDTCFSQDRHLKVKANGFQWYSKVEQDVVFIQLKRNHIWQLFKKTRRLKNKYHIKKDEDVEHYWYMHPKPKS